MADTIWTTIGYCLGDSVEHLSIHRALVQVINACYTAHSYLLMARLSCCALGISCLPFISVNLWDMS
jgi:hypothetical protein